jgi:alkylhydroperoxidase family enzyme
MEEADIQGLRDAGLSDAKIYYVVELAGLFNLTNRLTSAYGMRLDEDFVTAIEPQN